MVDDAFDLRIRVTGTRLESFRVEKSPMGNRCSKSLRCKLAVRIVVAHEDSAVLKTFREFLKNSSNAELFEASSLAECGHVVRSVWPELLFAPLGFLPAMPSDVELPLWISMGGAERHSQYRMVGTLVDPSRLAPIMTSAMAAVFAAKTASLCNLVDQYREGARSGDESAETFLIETEAAPLKIRSTEIRYVLTAANYLRLMTTIGTYETRRSLSAIEQRFVKCGFVRVRRSVLVNKSHITRLSIKSDKEAHLVMSDGAKLRIGSTYRHLIDDMEFGFAPITQFFGNVFGTEQEVQ